MFSPIIATARDLETRETRIIADALYDVRAHSTRNAQVRVVRFAAIDLGWSEAEVWREVNRLAGDLP